jgi:translation initiation factor 1
VVGGRGRTVYSTEKGRICARCGWPEHDCRCASGLEEPLPEKIAARLRIERSGRRGKTVTVVDGLPRNRSFLKALAKDLKRACGTGGTAVEAGVEIQGDHRERIREMLMARGWRVGG